MQDNGFTIIANDISNALRKIITVKPYVAIIDMLGNVLHADEPLHNYISQFQHLIGNTMSKLTVGDHSIPFSHINIVFFRISSRVLIALLNENGLIGELLAFKGQMFRWGEKIEEIIATIEPVII